MHQRAVVSALAAGAALLGSLAAWAQAAPKPPAPPAAAAAPKPAQAPAKKPVAAEPPAAAEATPGEDAAAPAGSEAEPSEPAEPETGTASPEQPAARPLPARPSAPTVSAVPAWPASGVAPLEHREERAKEKAARAEQPGERVWAEDWWSHARPVFELHGYFRVRTELFHRFGLGRVNRPDNQLFATPTDNGYFGDTRDQFGPVLCTSGEGAVGTTNPVTGLSPCRNQTNAGANMRFRLNPELHISDNLRVLSQIDLLDNILLGSTPEGYAFQPDAEGGYRTVKRGGYNALGIYDTSQAPPTAGVNSLKNSIAVKRVWAEYSTPVGELRFGRMPSHWGLGILQNAGDGYDDDYQNNVDRIMFVTGIKPLDLYLAGAWDFANEGPNSGVLGSTRGQDYDLGQLDDVDEYMLSVVRRQNPALVEQALAQGKVVVNGGAYLIYRHQMIANDFSGTATQGAWVPNATLGSLANPDGGYVRRHANLWIPDLWFQLKYNKFRFEAEAVTVQGTIGNTANTGSNRSLTSEGWKLRQYGIATETEFKAVEDKLKLMFMFGWASGDANATNLDPSNGSYTSTGAPGGLIPGNIGIDGVQPELGSGKITTFGFNPNYKVDLILNRNILSRIRGTYYLRPSVEYDFMRTPQGQRLGGGAAAIWTRASEFMQTPGHRRDLGIELDGKVYFQSKDGALNDVLGTMGGFYTQLEYGVLFPMGGLGYQPQEATRLKQIYTESSADTKVAQIVRWYLGVLF